VKGGYNPEHFGDLFAVEDRHFWFRARNRMISALAAEVVRELSPGFRVLEVGCGNGNVLRFLEQACPPGTVVGMDYFAEGLRLARKRCGCPLVQADLARPPFGEDFHAIGIFDVLEHLPEDVTVLRHLWRMLRPGGALLLTVPANPSLWSDFDEASGHCRRYEEEELGRKLREAGFEVLHLTPYMASIFPLVWLSRRRPEHADLAEAVRRELRIVPVMNDMLSFLLEQESRWVARRRRLPFGTSLVAIARKAAGAA
jgi:SAM-dependent methyltransferase